jgi:outer membrane protein assembly factor BamB
VLATQSDSRQPGWVNRLTALDIASGTRLWQRTLGRFYGFGGPAGDSGVVLFQWSKRTHAYAFATGRPLWTHDSIVASGAGLAVLRDGSSLVALDLQRGRERWRATVGPGQIPYIE